MQYIICVAGLPQEILAEVQQTPAAVFTTVRDRGPITRPISKPYAYRPGMSDAYLQAISKEIERFKPSDPIGIALAYVDYGGYTQHFVRSFFPFAITTALSPIYPETIAKHLKRSELKTYTAGIVNAVSKLRDRISTVRDVLSGQNFSPLTLPLRNFRSDVLQVTLEDLFAKLAQTEDARAQLLAACNAILARHPLERLVESEYRPYFEDNRGLRFKSPGRDRHGAAKRIRSGCITPCLINGRARLGGPLDANFHYDCEHEKRFVDKHYPNCHDAATQPSKSEYVNIAPNDYVR